MSSFCLLLIVSLSFLAGSTSGCHPNGQGQGSTTTSIDGSCVAFCGDGGFHINVGRKGGSDYVEKNSQAGNNNSRTLDGYFLDSKETSGAGEFEESAGENNDYNGKESSTDWLVGKMFAIRKGSNHAEKIRRTGSGTMEGDSQIDDIEETSGAEEFEESGEINGYNGDVYSGAWENV